MITSPFFKYNGDPCYGFRCTKPFNKKGLSGWYKVLQYLYHHPNSTKEEILNTCFPNRRKETFLRGWNSYLFSGLVGNNFISYDKHTRRWSITNEGKYKYLETFEKLNNNEENN